MTWTLGLLGTGRAGRALGWALQSAGWTTLSAWSRTMPTAAEGGALLDLTPLSGMGALREAAEAAEVLLLCVSDDAIPEMARALAPLLRPDQALLHVSGSVPSSVMKDAGVRASCASFHPLLSLIDPQRATQNLKRAFAAVEGEGRALEVAIALGGSLGCTVVPIQTTGKPTYHAAAVVVSNYFVTLFDAGLTLLERAGVRRPIARAMLSALAHSTLSNLSRSEPADALTGPARRGDAATISHHLAAIDADPSLQPVADLYRALLPPTIDLALLGGLSPALAHTLSALLAPPPKRSSGE
jgi:predicted short-subunit dehydrogenase-like oxidoreductase (DUF2520 family)